MKGILKTGWVFIFIGIFSYYVLAQTPSITSGFSVSPLSDQLKNQLIKTQLWQPSCPISLDNLRLLSIKYYDFSGKIHQGNLILNQSAAQAALNVFQNLYQDKFPIASVDTLIRFQGNWEQAEKNNVTYGFICKKDQAGNYTLESYGTVVTLNPVQNPEIIFTSPSFSSRWCRILSPVYICKKEKMQDHPSEIFPGAGMLSINRSLKIRGMVENVVPLWEKQGFIWSGHNSQVISWKKFVFHPKALS